MKKTKQMQIDELNKKISEMPTKEQYNTMKKDLEGEIGIMLSARDILLQDVHKKELIIARQEGMIDIFERFTNLPSKDTKKIALDELDNYMKDEKINREVYGPIDISGFNRYLRDDKIRDW